MCCGSTSGIGKEFVDVRNSRPWQEEFSPVGSSRNIPHSCLPSPRREFTFNGAPGVRSRRFVAVSAAESDGPKRPWFRKFLFESIEAPDFDPDFDIADDISEDPDSQEEDGVEFEPRADADDDPNLDEPTDEIRDEIDEMIDDDRRFFRWKMKNDARNELREFQARGIDPDGKDWEDWLDDSWNQDEDILGEGADGWYEAAPDWEKEGVPREPPRKPERGMKRTIKELFFRIFEPEGEVVEDLQFEERVFRFTSRTTVRSFFTHLLAFTALESWLSVFCLPALSYECKFCADIGLTRKIVIM